MLPKKEQKRTSNVGETKKGSQVTNIRKVAKAPLPVRGAVKENVKGETTSARKELGKNDSKTSAQKPVTKQVITAKKRVDVESVDDVQNVPKNLSKIKDSPSESLGSKTYSRPTPQSSVYDRRARKTYECTDFRAGGSRIVPQSPGKSINSAPKKSSEAARKSETKKSSTTPSSNTLSSKLKSESSEYDRRAKMSYSGTTKTAAERQGSPVKSLTTAPRKITLATLQSKTQKSPAESGKCNKNAEVQTSTKSDDEPSRLGLQRSKTRILHQDEIKFAKEFLPEAPEPSSAAGKEPPFENKAEDASVRPGNSKEAAEEDYEIDMEEGGELECIRKLEKRVAELEQTKAVLEREYKAWVEQQESEP